MRVLLFNSVERREDEEYFFCQVSKAGRWPHINETAGRTFGFGVGPRDISIKYGKVGLMVYNNGNIRG